MRKSHVPLWTKGLIVHLATCPPCSKSNKDNQNGLYVIMMQGLPKIHQEYNSVVVKRASFITYKGEQTFAIQFSSCKGKAKARKWVSHTVSLLLLLWLWRLFHQQETLLVRLLLVKNAVLLQVTSHAGPPVYRNNAGSKLQYIFALCILVMW